MIRISMSRFSRKTRAQGTPRSRRLRAVLRLEGLEARTLLSGATVYTVDSTSGGDTGSGDDGTLPYVIAAANINTNPDGSEITFDPTVFTLATPPIVLSYPLVLSETAGPEQIEGTTFPIISGGGSTQLFSVASGTTASMDGLSLEDGTVGSGGAGGIIENAGYLYINNSSITGGYSAGGGGGIVNTGNLTITEGLLKGNTAAGGGGGILNSPTGTLTISKQTQISDNTANYGGGIDNFGTMTMDDTSIYDNTATNTGGGVYNPEPGIADITVSQLFDNTAAGDGGGIGNPGGTLAISDTTLLSNTAGIVGGGISEGGGTFDAANDTIVGNNVPAGQAGGGIYVESGAEFLLNNTIVGLNTSGTGASATLADINGTVDPSSSYNLIGTGGSGGLVDGTGSNQVGVVGFDIGVGASVSGGGILMSLSPSSPAIDAGSNALAVDPSTGDSLTTDGYGNSRIINGTVDIGAYEATIPDSDLTLFVSTPPSSSVSTTDSFGLIVEALTPQGNVETDFSGPVTLALSGSGGGSLGGTSVMDAVDGVATFSGLSIASAGDYTIEAASGSLAPTSTATIDVTAPSTGTTGTGSTGTGSTGTGSTGTGSTGTGSTGTGSTGTGTPIVSTPLPTPPALISEKVLYVGKGRKKHIAGFDLEFSQPLGASAGNPAEYVLTQVVKHGRKLTSQPVAFTVDYGLGTQEVGLAIARKVPFTLGGQLRVVGSGPGGITSATGVALDGSDIGLAGNDGYFAILPKGRGIQPT